jgi:glutaredoxin 3
MVNNATRSGKMSSIEIYTQNTCPFCVRAKGLLNEMGLPYTEYEVSYDTEKQAEMIARSQRYTVPQIFVDDVSIGGSDELFDLVESGEFSQLLDPGIKTHNTDLEIESHV